MVVRPTREADFGAIAQLTNHYIEKTTIHFGYEPVTAEELRRGWEAARGRFPAYVAVADGGPGAGLIGFAKSGVFRERDAYSWIAELGVYVDPSMQGRGVGKALYGRLIEACRDAGFHTLIGGITLPNEASVRLHEGMGFRRVATIERAGWKFGKWHDIGLWQLMLRGAEHAPDGPPRAGRGGMLAG